MQCCRTFANFINGLMNMMRHVQNGIRTIKLRKIFKVVQSTSSFYSDSVLANRHGLPSILIGIRNQESDLFRLPSYRLDLLLLFAVYN